MQENTLLIFQIPRDLADHPGRMFFNHHPIKKEQKKENEPFSFSCHFYQSSTFHHHVSTQSCYKPTADTSNALSTAWPTSRGMKGAIIQNSHLLWVKNHSWKEGNNTIVQEKGHFSCSLVCLHHGRAGYALRRKPREGLWWRQKSPETLMPEARNPSITDEWFLQNLFGDFTFWLTKIVYVYNMLYMFIVLLCLHNVSFRFVICPKLGWGRSHVHISSTSISVFLALQKDHSNIRSIWFSVKHLLIGYQLAQNNSKMFVLQGGFLRHKNICCLKWISLN